MNSFVLRQPSDEQLEKAARVERAKRWGHDPHRRNSLQRYFEKRKQSVSEPIILYRGHFKSGDENQILDTLQFRQFNEWEHTLNGSSPHDNSGGFFQTFEIKLDGLVYCVERGQKLYSYDRSVLGEIYQLSVWRERIGGYPNNFRDFLKEILSSKFFVGSVHEEYPKNHIGEFNGVASLERQLEDSYKQVRVIQKY
jgi:hypothetical protein